MPLGRGAGASVGPVATFAAASIRGRARTIQKESDALQGHFIDVEVQASKSLRQTGTHMQVHKQGFNRCCFCVNCLRPRYGEVANDAMLLTRNGQGGLQPLEVTEHASLPSRAGLCGLLGLSMAAAARLYRERKSTDRQQLQTKRTPVEAAENIDV